MKNVEVQMEEPRLYIWMGTLKGQVQNNTNVTSDS